MRIHITDEHRQRLRPHARLDRTLSTFSCHAEHDPGVAKMHLRTLHRIAVAIVVGKSERARQPIDGSGDILVNKMRKNNIGWYGAILHNVSL